ncbi:MAG: hypothetical protein ACRDM1_00255 [Gaiellaceae bacterium]
MDARLPLIVPVLAIAAGALLTVGRSGATVGPAQIRITDLQISDHVVRPPSGAAVGSIEIVRQRLYNPRLTRSQIGRSTLICIYADRRERSCDGTYYLPRGEIVVSGAIQSRLLYTIPIVGGTGLYDDARGMLTVTSTHIRPRRELLLFRLPG